MAAKHAKKNSPSKPWAIETGHRPHMTGSGKHDSRPKRQRTRGAAVRAEIRSY